MKKDAEIRLESFFTIINLIVLYVCMKKFLYGPITAIMDKPEHDPGTAGKCHPDGGGSPADEEQV